MYNEIITAPAAAGFKPYAAGHILWLFGAFLLWMGIYALCKNADERRYRRLKICLAGLSLLMQLARALILRLRGDYGLSQLPLHLCSISVYLCFVYALCPKRLAAQFLFAFSLPGWLLALLFPGWRGWALQDAVCILSFLLHILPAGFVLALLFSGELRPDIRQLPRCIGLMLAAALPVYIINKKTGQNFMFLSYPPEGTPLELFSFLGRPGYLLGMLPMAGLIWLGLYKAGFLTGKLRGGSPSAQPAARRLFGVRSSIKKRAD